ncbi:MAG: response regulator [Bacteroidota bacterium]
MIQFTQTLSTSSTLTSSSTSNMKTNETSLNPIILIEDDETLLDLYVGLLEERIPEYEILPFHDGPKGLHAVQQRNPSLIITDLRLPDIDGLQILSEATKQHPNVPVIVVSGFFGLNQIKETIGESDKITFISKPFDSEIFASFVETLLTTDADSTINGISLLNIMQMISADQKSCYLELLHGNESGVVSFTQGKVRFARTGEYRGIEALMKIAEWEAPLIMIFNDRKTSKVNIHDINIDTLSLEIAHHLDQLHNHSTE